MGLFGEKQKKETISCACQGDGTQTGKCAESRVKVLGGGCAKCHALEKATVDALSQMGLNFEVTMVTDYAKIAEYGVMSTPALVLDGKVLSSGKVLKREEVQNLLEKALKE